MGCWICGAEFYPEELDVDPTPILDSLTGERIYECLCPHCGAAIAYLTEEGLYLTEEELY